MMLLQPIWIASGLSNKQWSTRVKPAYSNGSVNDQNFFAQPNVIMLKLVAMAAPRIGWID